MGTLNSKSLYLDLNNKGRLVFSTNTFTGGQYGVYVATQVAGTQVWLSSNTILVSTSATVATYGLCVNGLLSGATIQNNGIYYRRASNASSLNTTALYATASAGLVFERNRINNPGMITGGSFVGADLYDTDNMIYRYNDMQSSAPAIGTAILLRLNAGSTGMSLRNNVFFSSFTAPTVSSGTLIVTDAASQLGFSSNYNDYASSNSTLGFKWLVGAQGLAGWTAASGWDLNSISAHPHWFNVDAGVEDFHPKSAAANGRFNPITGGYDQPADAITSPMIDTADPADAFGNEPPNNGRANMGSYGNTSEASRVVAPPRSRAAC